MNSLQTDFEIDVDKCAEQHVPPLLHSNLKTLDLNTLGLSTLGLNTLEAKELNINALANVDLNKNKSLELDINNIDNPIKKALAQFNSHGLHDLNAAKLMDRVDSKFILPISFLPDLLSQLKKHYSVLEINENRVSSYQNKYFDTPDMTLYNNHHNGKLNRYKVRRRRYVDTNTEFLEVKLKNNKKRTIKNRIKLKEPLQKNSTEKLLKQSTEQVNEVKRCSQFINDQIKLNTHKINSDNLTVSQQSGYKRIALANEAAAERLTLDFELWYQGLDAKNKVKLPGFFIAELKQNKKSKRSPFYQMMSANNITPMAFSKYCIGCALLYKSSIKSNRFKPILSHIEKLNRNKPISFLKSI